MVFNDAQVIDPIVLNRQPESVKPFVPRLLICRGRYDQWNQFLLGPMHSVTQGSRRRVDLFQRRPETLEQRNRTVGRQNGVPAGGLLDFSNRFLQPFDREARTIPVVSLGPETGPECPYFLRGHGL